MNIELRNIKFFYHIRNFIFDKNNLLVRAIYV